MSAVGDTHDQTQSRKRPLIMRIWSQFRQADGIRRDIRHLARFSDHELRDLGIERATSSMPSTMAI